MKTFLYRYRILLFITLINLFLYLFNPALAKKSLNITVKNLGDMLFIMPPIFIWLGLLDVWVERETMIKFMGEGSGTRGICTAFLIGSLAAGPVYMAFPFTLVLIRKGAIFSNIVIFLGAWSATKIPISIFEASIMGWKFTLLRYFLDVIAIIIIAKITNGVLTEKEREILYDKLKN